MKYILSILLCSIFTVSYSQKCKETADPITNEKKVEFDYVDHDYGGFKLQLIGGKIKFSKVFRLNGANHAKAPAGLEFSFKLENGDILKLKSESESIPEINTDFGGTIHSFFNFTFELSKDDLKKFGQSPLIFIRAPKIISEGYNDFDKDASEVWRSKKPLQKGASCMSAYL
jgi:hypothetical protein